MGEETKDKKKAPKRSPLNGETIWFALPALAIVVFFGWVLMEMGSAGGGQTLVLRLLGIAATVLGGGLIFMLLNRFTSDD